MRSLLIAPALIVLALTGPAAAQAPAVETYGPRPFGHLIGDVLGLRADVEAEPPFRLDRASLPQTGPVTYALDLRRIAVTEQALDGGVVRYRIETEYQTFYAPLEPTEQTIPAFTVTLVDGARRRQVEVGRWTYLTSPLRPIAATAGRQPFALRPDAMPSMPSLAPARTRLAAAAGVALVLFVLLAWSRAWPPFHTRPARPFANAARRVRALAAGGDEGRRAALLALHRAFDVAAGTRLLGDDLAAFLKAKPGFARHEAAIAAFFETSRKTFFGGAAADGALPPDALRRLARDLAAAERAS